MDKLHEDDEMYASIAEASLQAGAIARNRSIHHYGVGMQISAPEFCSRILQGGRN